MNATEIIKEIEVIESLLQTVKEDTNKHLHGNASAGVRVRNAMLTIKKAASTIRVLSSAATKEQKETNQKH